MIKYWRAVEVYVYTGTNYLQDGKLNKRGEPFEDERRNWTRTMEAIQKRYPLIDFWEILWLDRTFARETRDKVNLSKLRLIDEYRSMISGKLEERD